MGGQMLLTGGEECLVVAEEALVHPALARLHVLAKPLHVVNTRLTGSWCELDVVKTKAYKALNLGVAKTHLDVTDVPFEAHQGPTAAHSLLCRAEFVHVSLAILRDAILQTPIIVAHLNVLDERSFAPVGETV